MTDKLPSALVSELRKLNAEQVVTLLGDILDPGWSSPFDLSDEMGDALFDTARQFRADFALIEATAEAERIAA